MRQAFFLHKAGALGFNSKLRIRSSRRTPLRALALGLAAAMLCQDLALAAPEIGALRPMLPFAQAFDYGIPSSVATVETIGVSGRRENPSAKRIILIRDAHANPSGQFNLAKTLDLLLAKEKLPVIYTEGADRDVSLLHFKKLADPATLGRVAKEYVYRGEIKGSEYLELTGASNFRIRGVEERRLYRKALDAYRAVAETRAASEQALAELRTTARYLTGKILRPELAELLARREAFRRQEGSWADYLAYLSERHLQLGSSSVRMDGLEALQKIRRREQKLNWDRIRSEWDAATRKGIDTAHPPRTYPHLRRYAAYRRSVARIQAAHLVRDQESLEAELGKKLARTEDEARFVRAALAIETLESLVGMTATPEDTARFRRDPEAHQPAWIAAFLNTKLMELGRGHERAVFLDETLIRTADRAAEFYRIADRRDRIFVRRTLRRMELDGLASSVLIAGGYHTEHLKALLRREGISCTVITPQVVHETDRRQYERLLLSSERSTLIPEYYDAVSPAAQRGFIRSLGLDPKRVQAARMAGPEDPGSGIPEDLLADRSAEWIADFPKSETDFPVKSLAYLDAAEIQSQILGPLAAALELSDDRRNGLARMFPPLVRGILAHAPLWFVHPALHLLCIFPILTSLKEYRTAYRITAEFFRIQNSRQSVERRLQRYRPGTPGRELAALDLVILLEDLLKHSDKRVRSVAQEALTAIVAAAGDASTHQQHATYLKAIDFWRMIWIGRSGSWFDRDAAYDYELIGGKPGWGVMPKNWYRLTPVPGAGARMSEKPAEPPTGTQPDPSLKDTLTGLYRWVTTIWSGPRADLRRDAHDPDRDEVGNPRFYGTQQPGSGIRLSFWQGRTYLKEETPGGDYLIGYKFANDKDPDGSKLRRERENLLFARSIGISSAPEPLGEVGPLTDVIGPYAVGLNPRHVLKIRVHKTSRQYLTRRYTDVRPEDRAAHLEAYSLKALEHLLAGLRHGRIHTSLTPLTHSEVFEEKWYWNVDPIGEVQDLAQAMQHPNLRRSGLDDYEHFEQINEHMNLDFAVGQAAVEWMIAVSYAGYLNWLSRAQIERILLAGLQIFYVRMEVKTDAELLRPAVRRFLKKFSAEWQLDHLAAPSEKQPDASLKYLVEVTEAFLAALQTGRAYRQIKERWLSASPGEQSDEILSDPAGRIFRKSWKNRSITLLSPTLQPIRTLALDLAPRGFAADREGRVATVDEQGIRVYDGDLRESGRIEGRFEPNLLVDSEGRIAAVDAAGAIRIWGPDLRAHAAFPRPLPSVEASTPVMASGPDGTLYVGWRGERPGQSFLSRYDLNQKQEIARIETGFGVDALAVDAEGRLIAGWRGRIAMYDGSLHKIRELKSPHRVTAIDVDPEGHILVADEHSNRLLVFDDALKLKSEIRSYGYNHRIILYDDGFSLQGEISGVKNPYRIVSGGPYGLFVVEKTKNIALMRRLPPPGGTDAARMANRIDEVLMRLGDKIHGMAEPDVLLLLKQEGIYLPHAKLRTRLRKFLKQNDPEMEARLRKAVDALIEQGKRHISTTDLLDQINRSNVLAPTLTRYALQRYLRSHPNWLRSREIHLEFTAPSEKYASESHEPYPGEIELLRTALDRHLGSVMDVAADESIRNFYAGLQTADVGYAWVAERIHLISEWQDLQGLAEGERTLEETRIRLSLDLGETAPELSTDSYRLWDAAVAYAGSSALAVRLRQSIGIERRLNDTAAFRQIVRELRERPAGDSSEVAVPIDASDFFGEIGYRDSSGRVPSPRTVRAWMNTHNRPSSSQENARRIERKTVKIALPDGVSLDRMLAQPEEREETYKMKQIREVWQRLDRLGLERLKTMTLPEAALAVGVSTHRLSRALRTYERKSGFRPISEWIRKQLSRFEPDHWKGQNLRDISREIGVSEQSLRTALREHPELGPMAARMAGGNQDPPFRWTSRELAKRVERLLTTRLEREPAFKAAWIRAVLSLDHMLVWFIGGVAVTTLQRYRIEGAILWGTFYGIYRVSLSRLKRDPIFRARYLVANHHPGDPDLLPRVIRALEPEDGARMAGAPLSEIRERMSRTKIAWRSGQRYGMVTAGLHVLEDQYWGGDAPFLRALVIPDREWSHDESDVLRFKELDPIYDIANVTGVVFRSGVLGQILVDQVDLARNPEDDFFEPALRIREIQSSDGYYAVRNAYRDGFNKSRRKLGRWKSPAIRAIFEILSSYDRLVIASTSQAPLFISDGTGIDSLTDHYENPFMAGPWKKEYVRIVSGSSTEPRPARTQMWIAADSKMPAAGARLAEPEDLELPMELLEPFLAEVTRARRAVLVRGVRLLPLLDGRNRLRCIELRAQPAAGARIAASNRPAKTDRQRLSGGQAAERDREIAGLLSALAERWGANPANFELRWEDLAHGMDEAALPELKKGLRILQEKIRDNGWGVLRIAGLAQPDPIPGAPTAVLWNRKHPGLMEDRIGDVQVQDVQIGFDREGDETLPYISALLFSGLLAHTLRMPDVAVRRERLVELTPVFRALTGSAQPLTEELANGFEAYDPRKSQEAPAIQPLSLRGYLDLIVYLQGLSRATHSVSA